MKEYRRSIEPVVDLFLSNPMYEFRIGYRRQEQWTTAHLNNKSRRTTDLYFSRFNVDPEDLPSLSLQIDKQKEYDHLDIMETDDESISYAVSSGYELPSRDVTLEYNLNYSQSTSETPLQSTYKSENDNFNINYEAGYSGDFWKGKADYYITYKGNYSRNKVKQFLTGSGTVLNERIPLGGFYVQDPTPGDGALTTESELIDNNFTAVTTPNINIGTGVNHNIGIWVSSGQFIDRLYIYINENVTGDTNLTSTTNWELYRSNSNVPATTWTNISSVISSVGIGIDATDNRFRYEIIFASPQSASYFKVVNQATVNVVGLTDVYVTEIEAYNTDTPAGNIDTTVFTSFTQGLASAVNVKLKRNLDVTLSYSLDRSDQQPVSIMDSVGGFFSNTLSDSVSDDGSDLQSNISRNYGIASKWLTHRLLTTSLHFRRSETFDNRDVTDIRSNTYNLSFSSDPLPTLQTHLSFIRNENYLFHDKDSTHHSLIFSVDSELYRDVNMITDFSYTTSTSHTNDSESSTSQINGTIDALFTRKTSGTLNYNFAWTSSDESSTRSSEGSSVITYRPGKFMNISGKLNVADSDGAFSTSQGLLMDWLPLKAIRLSANYNHTYEEEGSLKTDTVSSYVIWYITKFADLHVTYNFTQKRDERKVESHGFNTQLNCRF